MKTLHTALVALLGFAATAAWASDPRSDDAPRVRSPVALAAAPLQGAAAPPVYCACAKPPSTG